MPATRPPRVLFASENIQLGALVLLELLRMHRSGAIELVSVWSNQQDRAMPPMGAAAHEALLNASSVDYPRVGDGVILAGVFVSTYSILCRELGIKYHMVKDFNAVAGAALQGLDLDVAVCCGHSRLFPEAVLHAPRMGWLNAHPSLLPRHRGPMPGFWEMRAGEERSGVTLHVLTMETDGGPVVVQKGIELHPAMQFSQLVREQAAVAATLLRECLLPFVAGELKPVAQSGEPTHEPMPKPEDFFLDGEMSCRAVGTFVSGMRGIAPVAVMSGGQALLVEGIVLAVEDAGADGRPGDTNHDGRGMLHFRAKDGWVKLLVSDPQAGMQGA